EDVDHRGRPRRDQTNESLRIERRKTDDVLTRARDAVEGVADEVVRIARERADRVVQTARDDADSERPPQSAVGEASSKRERKRADGLVEDQRSDADALLVNERVVRQRHADDFLTLERDAMDEDLTGERAQSDRLVVDQREANQQMVIATLRARDLTVEADVARQRAEDSEHKLHAVAEFREMFIGILGHDLRNPLASISMATGLLLARGHLDDQDAMRVSLIDRNSQRITRMIHFGLNSIDRTLRGRNRNQLGSERSAWSRKTGPDNPPAAGRSVRAKASHSATIVIRSRSMNSARPWVTDIVQILPSQRWS
ncbi:MAG: histidine kinase dimerization/phospho-acceptor domain-containing protein, partial [Deltaproteobacteria bacterium]